MSPLWRALVLCVACGMGSCLAFADDAEKTLGGFMCVRPLAPSCAARAETYRSSASIAACRSEVDRFVAATVAYRSCLEGEISVAVRAANDVLGRFRCLSRGETCGTTAKRP